MSLYDLSEIAKWDSGKHNCDYKMQFQAAQEKKVEMSKSLKKMPEEINVFLFSMEAIYGIKENAASLLFHILFITANAFIVEQQGGL